MHSIISSREKKIREILSNYRSGVSLMPARIAPSPPPLHLFEKESVAQAGLGKERPANAAMNAVTASPS